MFYKKSYDLGIEGREGKDSRGLWKVNVLASGGRMVFESLCQGHSGMPEAKGFEYARYWGEKNLV